MQPQTVVIFRDNQQIAEYPLNTVKRIPVQGVSTHMIISISNGKVAVESSACPQQVCVRAGAISLPFQQLVCAPNHILIEIRSTKKEERPDAIAQ
jgi:hypothetical protein